MADFSSLSKGESLLAGNKKNDSLACKKGGGSAAKIAGAAIAGVALGGALAVGAAQSSLFSSGVGASGVAQAGAASGISSASSGAASAASSAQSKAATAITQGPGAQSNATLSSAQGDVNGAQIDASQLAGEKRAGADAQIAQGQSSVNNAQNYLASQTAAGQSNATAEKTLLAGKVNSALATAPPAPAGLAKPASGQLPTAPLPVNVPPPEKAVDQSVATPPSNLTIQEPKNASVPETTKPAPAAAQQAVADETLKQVALSKEELDKCADERLRISGGLQNISAASDMLENDIRNHTQLVTGYRKVSSGWFSSKKEIMAANEFSSMAAKGVPGAKPDKKYVASSEPKELREKYEFGPLVGLSPLQEALSVAINDVKYLLKCEELAPLAKVAGELSNFNVAKKKIMDLADSMWIDAAEPPEEITRVLKAFFPLWDEINRIAYLLPDKYLQAAGIKKGTK